VKNNMGEVKAISVKLSGDYVGHAMKKNQTIDLSFKFLAIERANAMEILSMVNQNIEVIARAGINKPIKIGLFNFNGWSCSRDGDVMLKLQSDRDFVDMPNIDIIAKADILTLMFKCEIEMDD